MPRVVPVQEFSLRESGDDAADAHGEEDEAELEVVEAVDLAELRGDADEDGVHAGEQEAHEDQQKAGFELDDHDEGSHDGVGDFEAALCGEFVAGGEVDCFAGSFALAFVAVV